MKIDNNFEIAFEFEEFYILINRKTNEILSWYERYDVHNITYYLLIKADQKSFDGYISNKISLLDTIKTNPTFFVKREFNKDSNELKIIEQIDELSKYKYIPTKDSYLGYDLLNI